MADAAPALDQGRYRLIEVLGEGGMALVYRAWDTRLRVWRAVKVLSQDAVRRKQLRERFEAEAQTMARLRHKNVLAVHDVGLGAERPYMVMDLVRGGSLVDWIGRHGPLPPRLAAKVMEDVLAGLQFAHDNGVVHRDVKPHNVLLDHDGTPLVADFGIARIDDGSGSNSKTSTGVMMGTLAYMAPEQRTSARRVDARADLYAAAGTLLALVTGKEPYDLYVPKELDKQLERVPEALAAIVRRGGAYDPADRYDSARDMAAAIAAARDGLPEMPQDTPPLAMVGNKTLPPPPAPEEAAPVPVTESSATFAADLGGGTIDTLDADVPRTASGTQRPVAITAPTSIAPATPTPLVASTTRSSTLSTEGKGGLFVGVGLGAVAIAVVFAGVLVSGVGIALYALKGSGTSTATAAPAPAPTPAAPVATAPPTAPPPVEPTTAPAPVEPIPEPVATPEAKAEKPPAPPPRVVRTAPPPPVAATAPVAETVAAPAGKGTLRVNSMPPGDVRVDGVTKGSTPWSTDAPSGPHEVVITAADGSSHTFDVILDDAEVEKLCWDFTTKAPCARR